jgi:hypothetical protein
MQAVRGKYQKNLQLAGWIRNDAIEEFGGGENAWDASSRVGPRTAQVKSADVLGHVVGTEPGTLSQNGFKLEGRAHVSIETGFEIPGGEDQLADEVFAEVGDNRFLEGGENAIGISFFLLFPIDLIPWRAEMGDGRKNVEAFVTLGG